MFEIDLLTKTGLQKARQKVNVDKKKQKQSIIFHNSDNSKGKEHDLAQSSSSGVTFISLFIFLFLGASFVFFGFFSDNNNLKINNFIPDNTSKGNANEYENVMSTIIKVLGDNDNSISLERLELSDNLFLSMNINSTDMISYIDAHSLFTYKIYNSNTGYKVHLNYPINNWTNDSFDSEVTLTNLIKYYKNDHNVKMKMDNESIYFITPDRGIIIRIFETLMFSGDIEVYQDDSSLAFNLLYKY